jgi:predicted dehydrogenase
MVNVGIIGSGYWGPNLIRNLNELDTATVQVVCDKIPERLDYVKTKFPNIAQTTTDMFEVIQNTAIEAVVVATPAETHYELVKAVLQSGKHVLVEKPLALQSSQAEELVRLAEERELVLMVGHTFLYNAAVQKLKEYITSGAVGQVYYIYAQRLNLGRVRQDLNALWNFAPHDISIIMYLLDGKPSYVSARGLTYLQPGIEDVSFLTLEFPGGTGAHVHISWLDPQKVRQMTVVGSNKMVVYDDVSADAKIQVYDKGVDKIPTSQSGRDFENFGEFQLQLRSGDVHIPSFKFTEPLRTECAHFIECIVQQKQPLTDGQNGLQVVKVLEAAQHSLKQQGTREAIVW